MEFADLKNKSVKELHELKAEKIAELHATRIKERTRTLKQVHQVSMLKRDIARIEMLLAAKGSAPKATN